jgi:hypothetical protein
MTRPKSFTRSRPHTRQTRENLALLTTITDSLLPSADHLVDLYAECWGIETLSRDLKTVFELESFIATHRIASAKKSMPRSSGCPSPPLWSTAPWRSSAPNAEPAA